VHDSLQIDGLRARLPPVRVLLTGMSGVGKSSLVAELRARGCVAYDADDDGFSEPRADGRWGWRTDAVAALLAAHSDAPLFFAGCSEEQAVLPFDVRVLLTAPRDEIARRLRTRATNRYGSDEASLAQVLSDLEQIEPLLRRSADLVLDTTEPIERVADRLLAHVTATQKPRRSGAR
jgi:broad-specificity NMP kinase